MGFGVWGLGLRVWSLGEGIWGLCFRVSGCMAWGYPSRPRPQRKQAGCSLSSKILSTNCSNGDDSTALFSSDSCHQVSKAVSEIVTYSVRQSVSQSGRQSASKTVGDSVRQSVSPTAPRSSLSSKILSSSGGMRAPRSSPPVDAIQIFRQDDLNRYHATYDLSPLFHAFKPTLSSLGGRRILCGNGLLLNDLKKHFV